MSGQKILKEDPSYSEDASEEDVEVYARQLGINVPEEQHLLWIAKEGIQAPLPVSWCPVEDEKGNIYYYNQETDVSTWEHPADSHFRELVKVEREKHKSKSLATESSDPGIDSKLSSLADAPPLTSGGKTSGSFSRDGRSFKAEHKTTISRSGTKEGSRLSLSSALDYLPEDIGKSKSSAFLKSFTPDGRKAPFSQRSVRFDLDDNSDEATHYSYEETDYDGEELPEMGGDMAGFMSDKLLLMDASQLSPILSSAGSPEPAAVNSLVKLGAQCSENNIGQLEALSKHFLDPSKREQNIKNESNEEVPSVHGESLTSRVKSKAKGRNSILEGSLESHILHTGNEVTFPLSPPAQEKKFHLLEEKWKRKEEDLVAEKMASLEELEDYWNNKFQDLEEEQKKLYEEKKMNWQRNLEEELSKQSEKELELLHENMAKDMEDEETALKITLEKLKQDNAEKLMKEKQALNEELQEAVNLLQEEMEQNNKMELEELETKLKEDHRQRLEELQNQFEEEHKQNLEKLQNGLEEEHKQALIELEAQLKEQNTKDLQEKEAEVLASQEKELKVLEEQMSRMFKEKQETYEQEFQLKVNELQEEFEKNLAVKRQSLEKEVPLSDSETLHLDIKHLKELHKSEMEAVDLLKKQKTTLEQERKQISVEIERQNSIMEEQRKSLLELQEQKYILQQDVVRNQKEVKNIEHYIEHLKRKSENIESIVKNGAHMTGNFPNHVEGEKGGEQGKTIKLLKDLNNSSVIDEDVSYHSKLNSPNEKNKFHKDVLVDDISIEHTDKDGSNVDHLKIRVDSLENCMKLLESKLEKKLYLDALRNRKKRDDINSLGFPDNDSHILHRNEPTLPNPTRGPGESDKNPVHQSSFPIDILTVPSYSGGHILSASGDGAHPSCVCDTGDACLVFRSLENSLQTLYHSLHLPSWTLSVCNDHSTCSTSNVRAQLHDYQQKLKEQRNSHQKSELKFKLTTKEFSCPSSQGSSSVLNDWIDELPLNKLDSNSLLRAQKLIRSEQKTRYPFSVVQENKQNSQDFNRLFINGDAYKRNGYSETIPPHNYVDTWPTFETFRKPLPTSIPSVHGTECAYSYKYGELPLHSTLPYTIKRVNADHEQWMARIDSMHQRIRSREKLTYFTRASLQTSN